MLLAKIAPLAVMLALAAASACQAQVSSFRIETDLFMADEKEPFAKNLTLFAPAAVYDFMLTEPRETTIFDAKRESFVILDETRRVKTTIANEELWRLAQEMKTQLLAGPANRRHLAEPEFQETFDSATRTLRMVCPQLTYEVKCEPAPDESAERRWRTFADWSAHLNATRPGQPPFPRLLVNEALNTRNLMPLEVELTMTMPGRLTNKTIHVRSKHSAAWRLTRSDQDRLEKADTYAATFKEVDFAEFRQLSKLAAAKGK